MIAAMFDYDPKEHYRACRVVQRYTSARWLTWGFGAVMVLLFSLILWSSWDTHSGTALLINASPWAVVALFFLVGIPLQQRYLARTLPRRDPSVIGPQERVVDASGFHTRGNGVTLDLPWQVMARAVESDQFFFFFYNKQLAYYLPKRALTAAQIAEARTLIRQSLGERALLSAE